MCVDTNPRKGKSLETLIIPSLPVPCGAECTVNEAVPSSYAHITRHKLVRWARKSCPFPAFQSDFPCGDQQKEKSIFPTWSLLPFESSSTSNLLLCYWGHAAALFIGPPGHPTCTSCTGCGKGVSGVHWKFKGAWTSWEVMGFLTSSKDSCKEEDFDQTEPIHCNQTYILLWKIFCSIIFSN